MHLKTIKYEHTNMHLKKLKYVVYNMKLFSNKIRICIGLNFKSV